MSSKKHFVDATKNNKQPYRVPEYTPEGKTPEVPLNNIEEKPINSNPQNPQDTISDFSELYKRRGVQIVPHQ